MFLEVARVFQTDAESPTESDDSGDSDDSYDTDDAEDMADAEAEASEADYDGEDYGEDYEADYTEAESTEEETPRAYPWNQEATTLPPEVVAPEVLESAGTLPWYDNGAESLRKVNLPADPKPPKPLDWTWDWDSSRGSTNTNWGNWQGVWDFIQAAVWVALAGLLLWLVFVLYRYYERQNSQQSAINAEQERRRRHEVDSIEHLPFQVDRPLSDLLSEARRHYQEGNYSTAIVYLFSYQLVELDRHQKIRLNKGKTNRQYLSEIRRHGELRSLLALSTHLFEDVFFGHYPLQRERFEQVWTRLEEFDRLAKEAT